MQCMPSAHRALRVLLQPGCQASRVELVRAVKPKDHAVLCDLAVANAALFRFIEYVLLDLIDVIQVQRLGVVLGIVYCQVHDHLAQIFVFLHIIRLKNAFFKLRLFLPEDFANIRMLFKQECRVQ